jgi:hypothetical protein
MPSSAPQYAYFSDRVNECFAHKSGSKAYPLYETPIANLPRLVGQSYAVHAVYILTDRYLTTVSLPCFAMGTLPCQQVALSLPTENISYCATCF